MKRILISPNAFKGSLSAQEVAVAIKAGLKKSRLDCECYILPVADGGDGSLDVMIGYLGADIQTETVHCPLGQPVSAEYGWNAEAGMAIVELAKASGIQLLRSEELDPWRTTTFGTGQLIDRVLRQGARTIYLTVGGSATVDGALGILDALGVEFFCESGTISKPLPTDLSRITNISLDNMNPTLQNVELYVLCDVANPLLGPDGAATVFAPQKGALPADIPRIELGFENLARVIERKFGKNIREVRHGGAAGGVAAVLWGVLGAKLKLGGEEILKWANFDEALSRSDVVITGEGKIDTQTSFGKAPGLVASKARLAGKYVIGICGSVDPGVQSCDPFDVVLPVMHGPDSLDAALANTVANIERTAIQIGNLLAFGAD